KFARAIQPEHAEEVGDWLTKPSSSSSSSATQAETTPTSAIEESAELFDHSISHLHLDDVQPLLDSDVGPEFEDDRNMSLENGRNTGKQIGIHVPQAAVYCQVVSSGNDKGGDDDDDEVTDAIWVPDRAEEETEDEAAQPQGGRHQERVESSHPIPSHSAAVISRPTPQSSAVWAFFSTSAADHTVAICKLCLRHIKHGKYTSHLGTTCLTRHLTSNHSACWQEHLKATQKGHKSVPPPPYPLQSAPAI
ncbi:hypothetical protein AB205_0188470, partial [Aquarana catesbeiana]